MGEKQMKEWARVPAFRSLDALRGVAALWVVLDHSCVPFLATADPRYYRWPIYAVSVRGQLGVVLFFIISGYCITSASYSGLISGKSPKRWAFERIRRIYPPYVGACVIAVAVTWLLVAAQKIHFIPLVHHQQTFPPTLWFWFSNVFLIQAEMHQPLLNITFWSLCYEIAFYLIVGLFLVGAQRFQSVRILCNGIGVTTVFSLLWLLISPASCIFPIDRWYQFGLGGLLFFALEVRSSEFLGFRDRIHKTALYLTLILVPVIILFAVYRKIGGQDIGHPSSKMQAMFCLFCIAFLPLLHHFDERLGESLTLRPFFWLGSFSYSLYLIHPYVLGFIDFPMRHFGVTGNLYLLTFIVEIAVAIATGWIYFRIVERHFISSSQKRRLISERVIEPAVFEQGIS
jgi:peptidoglycan/LPS O-acetylase OafA/YrhL